MKGSIYDQENEAPPAYEQAIRGPSPGPAAANDVRDLTDAAQDLRILDIAEKLDENSCLTHLKLLSLFHILKDDISHSDGLFGLWDAHAAGSGGNNSESLAKICEKRWVLFVARAVDRYESWWHSFGSNHLLQKSIRHGLAQYRDFRLDAIKKPFHSGMLPPIDVLLVWHAHMLNPRMYLEDCLRYGLSDLWKSGIPWRLIDNAIDEKLIYCNNNKEAEKNWTAKTARAWENSADNEFKDIECIRCKARFEVPWTTCGQPETSSSTPIDLVGNGYGDGSFSRACNKCGTVMNNERLEMARFAYDFRMLVDHDYTLPGTVIDCLTGLPDDTRVEDRLIPNHLIGNCLDTILLRLINNDEEIPTMENVRQKIQASIGSVKKMTRQGRFHTRKMMSKYWGNHSSFSLDLNGAVHRQSVFTEKMHKIDWLHSPAAWETMSRLITKYERFVEIMSQSTNNVCVPTLDVDLAWHTQQLSPRLYYNFTTLRTSSFVNHDDKIDEVKLSTAFEWTCKTYEERYGEVYSECTCWYCEAIRASYAQGVDKVSGLPHDEGSAFKQVVGKSLSLFKHNKFPSKRGPSKSEKAQSKSDEALLTFYTSGRAGAYPPNNSPHVSDHNAVRMTPNLRDLVARKVYEAAQEAQAAKIEQSYRRALERAEREGRSVQSREDYYRAKGYNHSPAPFAIGSVPDPTPYASEIYPCSPPGEAAGGSGFPGACAAGTCRGGTASGACSGPAAGGCSGGGCADTMAKCSGDPMCANSTGGLFKAPVGPSGRGKVGRVGRGFNSFTISCASSVPADYGGFSGANHGGGGDHGGGGSSGGCGSGCGGGGCGGGGGGGD